MTNDDVVMQNVAKEVYDAEKQRLNQEKENLSPFGAEDDDDMEIMEIGFADKLVIKKSLSEFFMALFQSVKPQQKRVSMDYVAIMKEVSRSKEREKKSIKDHFKKMDAEERKAEIIMKKYHLGNFFVNEKALVKYGKETTQLFGAEDTEDLMAKNMQAFIELEEDLSNIPPEFDDDVGGVEDPDDDMHDIAENAFDWAEYGEED